MNRFTDQCCQKLPTFESDLSENKFNRLIKTQWNRHFEPRAAYFTYLMLWRKRIAEYFFYGSFKRTVLINRLKPNDNDTLYSTSGNHTNGLNVCSNVIYPLFLNDLSNG